MRPHVATQTGVGQSDPYIVNHRQNSFKMSISTQVTGTATYTIQHTLDNPWETTDTTNNTPVYADAAAFNANAQWVDIDLTELVDATDAQDGNYFFPVRAVRINQTAGDGTVEATFIVGNAT